MKRFISAGDSAKTAFAFTIVRTRDSRAASRSIPTTWGLATSSSNTDSLRSVENERLAEWTPSRLAIRFPEVPLNETVFYAPQVLAGYTASSRVLLRQGSSRAIRNRKSSQRLRQPLLAFRRAPAHRLV